MNANATAQIIAKEGWNQVVLALTVFLLSYVLSFFPWFFFAVFLFVLFIYRNPERIVEEDDQLSIVAPIDGKIIKVAKVHLDDGTERLSVVIKKKILDVGVMRAPMVMNIIDEEKRFGLFLPPNSSLFSALGEKLTLTCKGKFATINMVISAGRFSQRISLFDKLGKLKSGQRIGFLNDGEVTLLLPLDTRIKVSLGDEVKSAIDVLGYLAYKDRDEQ